jgi:hypothetical protein
MTPVKIEFPKNGTGTKVLVECAGGEWAEVQGVRRIEISPIEPDNFITVTLDVHVCLESLNALAILSQDSLASAAEHYGLKLVPVDG